MSGIKYTAQAVIVTGVSSGRGAPAAHRVNRPERPASEARDLPARRGKARVHLPC